MALRVESIAEVEARSGLKKSAIYELISKGLFPRSICLIPGSRTRVGWLSEEVDAWIASRRAERDAAQQAAPREGVKA